MNIPFPYSLRPEQIEPGLHEFAQCEMHTVRPLLGGASFTCMTTEYDFILVHQPGPMHTLTGGDEILVARGLPTSMLDDMRRTRERSLEHITDIFANDSFVRSRECRRRAMQHYLRLLQEFENVLHEHMSRPGDDRPWGDKHDPAAVRDRARDAVRRLFHLIAWSHRSPCCSAPNPIVAAVHEARLQKEFTAWCQQAPVDDAGRYGVPECPARVQATLAELFHGSFFVHDGVNITTLL